MRTPLEIVAAERDEAQAEVHLLRAQLLAARAAHFEEAAKMAIAVAENRHAIKRITYGTGDPEYFDGCFDAALQIATDLRAKGGGK